MDEATISRPAMQVPASGARTTDILIGFGLKIE